MTSNRSLLRIDIPRPLRRDGTPLEYVRFLADDFGVYGLSVEPLPQDDTPFPVEIVSRPDKVADAKGHVPTLFHGLPKRDAGWACHTAESQLADQLLGHWLIERCMTDRRRDAPALRTYHGLKSSARSVISKLVRELYGATIPQHYLKLIRRYPISTRGRLFRGLCADGDRAWQLAESFPFLAALLYAELEDTEAARQCVVSGRKLAEVADSADVPLALRRLPPAVMQHAIKLRPWLISHPGIVAHHAPATVPRMRSWLKAIYAAAAATKDMDYVVWVAKHWDSLGHWRGVDAVTRDLGDWVKAGKAERARNQFDKSAFDKLLDSLAGSGRDDLAASLRWWEQSVRTIPTVATGRPFSNRMSPRTVLRLSAEWHERAAEAEAVKVPFPTPWYAGDVVDGYSIEPITSAVDLSRYAFALHNCASQSAQDIAADGCFLYIVMQNGNPVAMLELVRNNEKPEIRQLAGPCNIKVDKAIEKAARTWFRRRRKAERLCSNHHEFDDDFPF